MKLSNRQKEIILQLICEEIEQLNDDVEDGPEAVAYFNDLVCLEPLFCDGNRIEIYQ